MHHGDFSPADIVTLKRRAELVRRTRSFFHDRGYWECVTSPLSEYATTDAHVDSLQVVGSHSNRRFGYLHTSPEFAMKRLLASGSGAIFQFSEVFRDDPEGPLHSPDFTLLEWYRPGFSYTDLMDEIDALLVSLAPELCPFPADRITYRDVFIRYLDLDPFAATVKELQECANHHHVVIDPGVVGDYVDEWLNLLFGLVIEPLLDAGRFTFVMDFPAAQASLAKVRDDYHPVAERFELFFAGTEIANGYAELTDAEEQSRRFEADNLVRQSLGKSSMPEDESLVHALRHGLPDCAGVAVGFDRLAMILTRSVKISQVRAS